MRRKARLTAASVTVDISAHRPGSHPREIAMEPERAMRFIQIVFEAHHFFVFSMYVLLWVEMMSLVCNVVEVAPLSFRRA